ncbi:ATP-grasp domain-containing protein [Flexibacterium corallicola]|uniref:ATP-grasp domain-containing protein n=1 Tax=Flexibacterium corallicola TaxID=3037259 RepID=UPI00286ECAC9|nr:ATP-grasp domain-containing protein [Pseudovibrio sp. M1P-2-3]
MDFVKVTPDTKNLPIALQFLAEHCAALGASIYLDNAFHYVGYIERQDKKRFPFKGTAYGLNPFGASEIARDKNYAGHLLHNAGLPCPDSILIHSSSSISTIEQQNPRIAKKLKNEDQAIEFAQQNGWPVFVKPNDGSQGRGVSQVNSEKELLSALQSLLTTNDCALVQQRKKGRDFRVLVLDDKVKLVVERAPLSLTGDGQATISQQLEEIHDSPKGTSLFKAHGQIIEKHLRTQALSPSCVLERGQTIQVLPNSNLSTGGTAVDQTDHLSSALKELALQAAQCIGLRYAGVDLMVPELDSAVNEASILEINAAPGLNYFARSTAKNFERCRQIYREVLEALLESERGA